jgi:hypothetical protein
MAHSFPADQIDEFEIQNPIRQASIDRPHRFDDYTMLRLRAGQEEYSRR